MPKVEFVSAWLKCAVFFDEVRLGVLLTDTRQWIQDEEMDALTTSEKAFVIREINNRWKDVKVQ